MIKHESQCLVQINEWFVLNNGPNKMEFTPHRDRAMGVDKATATELKKEVQKLCGTVLLSWQKDDVKIIDSTAQETEKLTQGELF